MEHGPGDPLDIPMDILKEFQSLKSATNLNSADFMKSLLSSFRKETTSPRSEETNTDDTELSLLRRSPFPMQSKIARQKSAPGQKLNRVCEILQVKRAAKEHTMSSSRYDITNDVMMSHDSGMTSPTAPMTSRREVMMPQNGSLTSQDDEVLDLSVKKGLDQHGAFGLPSEGSVSPMSGDLCMDLSGTNEPLTPSWDPVKPETVLPELSWGFTAQPPIDDIPVIPPVQTDVVARTATPSHAEVKNFLRNAVDRKREAAKPKRVRPPNRNKKGAQDHEGLRLVNENSLFPGVYTGTFKLPGCRRGGRKHTIKNRLAEAEGGTPVIVPVTTRTLPITTQSPVLQSSTSVSSVQAPVKAPEIRVVKQELTPNPITVPVSTPEMRIQVPIGDGGTQAKLIKLETIKTANHTPPTPLQSQLMTPPQNVGLTLPQNVGFTPLQNVGLTPGQNVSLTSPQTIGLTSPQNVGLTPPQNVCLTSPQNVGVPITSPQNVGLTSPPNVGVTQQFQPIALSQIPQLANAIPQISSQCGTITLMLSTPQNIGQYQGAILPQQCFMTIPTNQGLMNLIPMQILPQEAIPVKDNESETKSTTSSTPTIIPSMLSPELLKVKTEPGTTESHIASLQQFVVTPPVVQAPNTEDKQPNANDNDTEKNDSNTSAFVPACMAQTQTDKHQEEMRVRSLKTDLVRSDSNFYCCSFKLNPQKPEVRKARAPTKRNRGRPKDLSEREINSAANKERRETTQADFLHELFMCKVCNKIVSTSDKYVHMATHDHSPRQNISETNKSSTKPIGTEPTSKRISYDVKVEDLSVTDDLASPDPTCSTCGVQFQPVVTLGSEEHVDGNDRVHCQQCTEMFSRETNKAKILANKWSPPTKITCDKCGHPFAHQTSLLEHRKLIHGENTQYFVCDKCDKILYSPSTYRYHLTTHGNVNHKPVTCTENSCTKICRNDVELKRHVRLQHSNKIDYPCDHPGCKKRFRKTTHLQEHVRVKHMKIKPFSCCWSGCSKQFSGVRHLKVHMLIHSDEKPLRCEYCDYRCRQRNALNWHMRKHPDVPYHKHYKTTTCAKSSRWRAKRVRKSRTAKRGVAEKENVEVCQTVSEAGLVVIL